MKYNKIQWNHYCSCTGTISVVVLDAAAATDVAPATVCTVKAFAGVFINVSGRAVAVGGELCVL